MSAAVVRSEDHVGVVRDALLIQRLEDRSQTIVEMLDHGSIDVPLALVSRSSLILLDGFSQRHVLHMNRIVGDHQEERAVRLDLVLDEARGSFG